VIPCCGRGAGVHHVHRTEITDRRTNGVIVHATGPPLNDGGPLTASTCCNAATNPPS
jgi:hypothetical protein